MNIEWGQTTYSGREKSWHIFNTTKRAMCGRRLDPLKRRDTLGSGKSCESCLRINARYNDKA